MEGGGGGAGAKEHQQLQLRELYQQQQQHPGDFYDDPYQVSENYKPDEPIVKSFIWGPYQTRTVQYQTRLQYHTDEYPMPIQALPDLYNCGPIRLTQYVPFQTGTVPDYWII